MNTTTDNILATLSDYRRPFKDTDADTGEFSDKIRQQVEKYVAKGEPIRLVMPAFPDKSVCRGKTLSNKADKAEELSIKHFLKMADAISDKYTPGVKIVIYSDGGVFHGMRHENYTTEDRLAYAEKLKAIIKNAGGEGTIELLDSENLDLSAYQEPEKALKQRIDKPQTLDDENVKKLYMGQKTFWREELYKLEPTTGKNAVKRRAGKMALDITAGSAAFSRYIDEKEPDAVRLSCHPKHPSSDKIGVWFNEGKSPATPWHNAAARIHKETPGFPEMWSMLKADTARGLGLEVVNDTHGEPSHFDIPDKLDQAASTIQRAVRKKISLARQPQQLGHERPIGRSSTALSI